MKILAVVTALCALLGVGALAQPASAAVGKQHIVNKGGKMYTIIMSLIALLSTGLLVAFLPAILTTFGLRKHINDNALSYINAALIAYTLIFAVIKPLTEFANYFQ